MAARHASAPSLMRNPSDGSEAQREPTAADGAEAEAAAGEDAAAALEADEGEPGVKVYVQVAQYDMLLLLLR